MILISIIILNYNGKKYLQSCLNSIFAQNFKNFEVIFVDNNSVDDSVKFVEDNYPEVLVLKNKKNLGFAAGNNAGLTKAKGEWIFFLNNDAFLEENCLNALVERIKNRTPEQLIFAPLMLKADFPEQIDSAGEMLYPWGYARKQKDKILNFKEITIACCGAAIFNKELLMKINGFDEDFFLYYEDVDLCLQARRIGAQIWFIPEAKVFHKGSATVGKRTKQRLYYIERNRFYTKLKNFPFITLIKYFPHSVVCSILSFILWTCRGYFFTWIKAHFAIIKGIPKMLKKRKLIFSKYKISNAEFESYLFKGSFLKWLKSL